MKERGRLKDFIVRTLASCLTEVDNEGVFDGKRIDDVANGIMAQVDLYAEIPNLELATTKQIIESLKERADTSESLGEGWLNYRPYWKSE